MSNLLIYIFLISIYNVVLFFGYKFGLNVILFNVVLLGLLIFSLYKNKKIKNKYGLLFSIPIIITSLNYLLYSNYFGLFNIIMIPILFCLLLIFTIYPSYKFIDILSKGVYLLFMPFGYIGNLYRVVSMNLEKYFKLDKKKRRTIISYLIIIPIIFIVLFLLITADSEFRNMFTGIYNIFKNVSLFGIIGRVILFFIVFTYLGCFINYYLFGFKDDKDNDIKFKVDSNTMKRLLIILNVIYIIFDIIQVRSLLLHHVGDGIVYSEYARSGFFQLMVISLINISILLITKHCKEEKIHRHMSLVMVLLTFVIILSSIYRMYMYDVAYGYTFLRLMVYVTLITELLLLIPTIIYIYKDKFKVLKYYLIIMVSVYSLINLVSIDKVIAFNNINRYYRSDKLDYEYLENYRADNIPILYDLYKNTKDKDLKNELEDYFITFRFHSSLFSKDRLFEYNMSREKAYKIIDEFYHDYDKKIKESN